MNNKSQILGKYLEMPALIDILRREDHKPLQHIPAGRKENVYYIIDNADNVERRKTKRKCVYQDDCGSWIMGSMCTRFLVEYKSKDRTRREVVFKNGVYGLNRSNQGKSTFVPLDPQPDKNQVLEVHRAYFTHSMSTEYKRRISWMTQPGANLLPIAIAEYIGIFPNQLTRGGAIVKRIKTFKPRPKPKSDYVRMSAQTMEELARMSAKTVVDSDKYHSEGQAFSQKQLETKEKAKVETEYEEKVKQEERDWSKPELNQKKRNDCKSEAGGKKSRKRKRGAESRDGDYAANSPNNSLTNFLKFSDHFMVSHDQVKEEGKETAQEVKKEVKEEARDVKEEAQDVKEEDVKTKNISQEGIDKNTSTTCQSSSDVEDIDQGHSPDVVDIDEGPNSPVVVESDVDLVEELSDDDVFGVMPFMEDPPASKRWGNTPSKTCGITEYPVERKVSVAENLAQMVKTATEELSFEKQLLLSARMISLISEVQNFPDV